MIAGAGPAVSGVTGIVVAGGAGRRLGGVDKAALVVGGTTLLDRVLAAARPVCDRLVVVGPERPTGVPGVTFAQEAEPGGGPVPAVAAGLSAVPDAEVVLVLAADLPLLATADLRRLIAALGAPGVEAAAAAGDGGPNPLVAAYRADVLAVTARSSGAGDRAGGLLPRATVTLELGTATFNVNRPEDLAAARRLVGPAPPTGESARRGGQGLLSASDSEGGR